MKKQGSRRRKKIGACAWGLPRRPIFAAALLFRRFLGLSFSLCSVGCGGCLTRRVAARLLYQAPATVPKVRFYIVKQLKMLSVYAIIYLLK